jgi:transposase
MQTISTIGLDVAKSVFQVHGVDAAGRAATQHYWQRLRGLAL